MKQNLREKQSNVEKSVESSHELERLRCVLHAIVTEWRSRTQIVVFLGRGRMHESNVWIFFAESKTYLVTGMIISTDAKCLHTYYFTIPH